MVPGSTLMYGSSFWKVMRRPRDSKSAPMAAAATPLPREDSTPPVIKISLVFTGSLIYLASADVKKGLERPAAALRRASQHLGAAVAQASSG